MRKFRSRNKFFRTLIALGVISAVAGLFPAGMDAEATVSGTLTQVDIGTYPVIAGLQDKGIQLLNLSVAPVPTENDPYPWVGSAYLNYLTVTRIGTAVDSDTLANGVKLWLDNGDNAFAPFSDQLLSTSATFNEGIATFGSIGLTLLPEVPRSIWITISVPATAAVGHTIGTQISSPGDVDFSYPNTLSFSAPLNGNLHTIISSEPPHSPVPIPSSLLLMGSGLVGMVGIARRRLKK